MTLITARKVFSLSRKTDLISVVDNRSHPSTPRVDRRRGSKGFVLPELLVVCAIIGIAVVFTLMYSQGFYRAYKLSKFKAAIPNAVNLARARAIGTQRWTSLRFKELDRSETADYSVGEDSTSTNPLPQNALLFTYSNNKATNDRQVYEMGDSSGWSNNPTIWFNQFGYAFVDHDPATDPRPTSPSTQNLRLRSAYDWFYDKGSDSWKYNRYYKIDVAPTGKVKPIELAKP